MDAGTWWQGRVDEPPADIRSAAKYAVIELVLNRRYRGQGIGKRLLNMLLTDRPEQYAVLLARLEAPARAMYDRWGWRPVGTVQSYPHWNPDTALVLPLPVNC